MVSLMSLGSCTNGLFDKDISPQGVEESFYDLEEFDEINYGHAFNVEIVQSSQFKLTAVGDRRDLDDLDVQVKNGELNIDYLKNGWFSGSKRYRMDLVIEVPTFSELDVSGASDTEVLGFTNLSQVDLDISGASKVRFKSVTNEIFAAISGASTLNLYEKVALLDADISGASKLNAVDEDIVEAVLELSGASRATVAVSDRLEVNASGASTVRYRGDPEIRERTSGASKVVKD